MFEVKLGSVPEWFGAASLLLAFWIFATDRRNRARRQVDQVGVWYENLHVTQGTAPKVTLDIVARNASLLPVRLTGVTYALTGESKDDTGRSRRLRPIHASVNPHPSTLPPGGGESRTPVEHPLEAESAGGRIWTTCQIDRVTVVDNAGRQWLVTARGRAKRSRAKRN